MDISSLISCPRGGEAIDIVGLISMRVMGAKIQATNASGYHINICSDNNILLEDLAHS